jgi:hypothetical protein
MFVPTCEPHSSLWEKSNSTMSFHIRKPRYSHISSQRRTTKAFIVTLFLELLFFTILLKPLEQYGLSYIGDKLGFPARNTTVIPLLNSNRNDIFHAWMREYALLKQKGQRKYISSQQTRVTKKVQKQKSAGRMKAIK